MKKAKPRDYELFYLEIPQADYLNNIDTEISDDHVHAVDKGRPGLSDEQVSQIARDQLNATRTRPAAHPGDAGQPFSARKRNGQG